jgi:hypothetical protein
VWYQSQLLVQDRQEQIEREIVEARMNRLATAHTRTPVKSRRIRFLNRR